MIDVFWGAFAGMLNAVLKILLIAVIAGVLVRRNIIKQEYIKGFSDLTVNVLLPSLIFSNVITNFSPHTNPNWWMLPLVSILVPFVALFLCLIVFNRKFLEKLNISSLAAFQNAGFLVLPLGELLFPDHSEQFSLYVFLYLLGFNPILWSLGKVLVTKTNGSKNDFKLKDILTPPLLVNIIAIILVLLKLQNFIPQVVISPISMLGRATVPMALFILGATLSTISLRKFPPFWDIFAVILIKFIALPSIALIIIMNSSIQKNAILSSFILIEASAAPAANLIMILKKYGGDTQAVGSTMLIAYFIALLMMPFWLAVYYAIT